MVVPYTQCRHCESRELYMRNIEANGMEGPRLLPLGAFTGGSFDMIVCCNCGLTEWFVHRSRLKEIKRKFAPVHQPPPKH